MSASPAHALAPAEMTARIAEILAKSPWEMTPVIARSLGIPEVEVLRHYPGDAVTALDATKVIDIIKSLEPLGRVHVIASNEGCTLEAYGEFGNFSLTGPFFNVQTKTLDMHIRHATLKSVFAMIKPSHQDGQTTYSIQFFTERGSAAFKVFLYKTVTDAPDVQAVIAKWEDIRARFRV